jgi:predicted phosphodiesterase
MSGQPSTEQVAPARPRPRRRWRRIVLAGVAGAVVAGLVMPYVHTGGTVGPARVDVVVRPSLDGDTVIGVPPFGRVLVDSHAAPAELRATIQELDVPALQRLATKDDIEAELRSSAEGDVAGLVRRAAIRLVVITALAGAVVGLLLGRRRRPLAIRTTAAATGGALIVTVSTLALVWAGYRVSSFEEPRYTGALERAPAVVDAVQREFGDLSGMRGRLKVLASQISELTKVATGPPPAAEPGEVRLLHISDVHLNPLGLEVARNLADTFAVHAVIDTGDLTSFGIDGESRIASLIESFDAPYYLVPGNHDSEENRAALARYANLTVLDGDVVDIAGVRVLGVPDPGYTTVGGISREAAVGLRNEHADEVADLVRRSRPDVLAVAGLSLADESIGKVPLVVSGDTHERSEREEDGTRLLTVGSTGATGLGSFTVEEDRPYEAEILHLVDGRLVSLDYVTVKGEDGAFTVDRVVYAEG